MHPQMARDLFPAGFVSCWGELSEGSQAELVRSLEAALASPSIPADIVTALLNLAEFMEHNEKSLPLDTRCAACHRKFSKCSNSTLKNPGGSIQSAGSHWFSIFNKQKVTPAHFVFPACDLLGFA